MQVDGALDALSGLFEPAHGDTVRLERLAAEAGDSGTKTEMTLAIPFEAAAESVTVHGGEFVDGTIRLDVSVATDADAAAPATESGTERADAGEPATRQPAVATEGDDSVPAYKDPERLQAVYDEYDSFSAMKAALDVDVTAQTVRRNMMKEGIHTPDTADGESADSDSGDDESAHSADSKESEAERRESGADEQASVDGDTPDDGSGSQLPDVDELSDDRLPDGITPDAVRDAVAESSSLHGAQMALDLDIKETRRLLQELGVLGYVTGRIADHDTDPDPADIERTITDSLQARADGSGEEH